MEVHNIYRLMKNILSILKITMGYTKLAIEENLKWYSQLKGIHFAALRYLTATGYDY